MSSSNSKWLYASSNKYPRPVALRPTLSGMTYAALVLHGLFHVPQLKQAIANWLPIPIDGASRVSDLPEGPGAYTCAALVYTSDLT